MIKKSKTEFIGLIFVDENKNTNLIKPSKKVKEEVEKNINTNPDICDHPDEDWVYDESGVDMYCKKCDELDNNKNQKS